MNRLFFIAVILLVNLNLKAQSKLDSLLLAVDTSKVTVEQIDLYYEISREYQKTDNVLARKYAQIGTQVAKELNDSSRIANGFYKTGTALSNMSMNVLALDNYIAAKEIAIKIKDSSLLCGIVTNIGNIYWFQDNIPMALNFYKDAMLYSKFSNKRTIAGLTLNIGLAFRQTNELDSGFFYINSAISQARAINDSNLIGLILINKGNPKIKGISLDSVKTNLDEALKYEKFVSMPLMALLYENLHLYEIEKKNFIKAKEYLTIAKSYAINSRNDFALQQYLEIKFGFDTLLRDYKSAVKTQAALMSLKDSISSTETAEKIANFQSLYELEKKESELKILKSNNEIYSLENKQNKLWLGVLVLVSLFILVMITIITRSNKAKAKSIEILSNLNIELRAHREEMTAMNEELSMNQEELYEKNKHLESTISQLKLAQNQLIQSEKIASIGILARGVAHELINPLNFINGGIAILQDVQTEDPQIQEKTEFPLQMMTEGIERAVSIVKQLSSFIDQGNSKPQPTNINQIIKSTLVFINYKIDLETQLLEEYGKMDDIYCYPDKIHAIMFQLLTNAIDAVKTANAKKTISVATALISKDQTKVVEINIFNSGKPIEASILQKIIDPLFTFTDPNNGMRMGLTIAYNLVKEQNGTLEVHNLNDGVLFTVSLPLLV